VLEVVGDNDEALRLTRAEIVGRYKLGFAQESVLLTQSAARVCSWVGAHASWTPGASAA
jgi:hypothetical protein